MHEQLIVVSFPQQQTDFDQFWSLYPRKRAKGDAMKAWSQTRRDRPPNNELFAALQTAKNSDDWLKDGGQFIPYPATWLRRLGWLDEYEQPNYCKWPGCNKSAGDRYCAAHQAAIKRGETP